MENSTGGGSLERGENALCPEDFELHELLGEGSFAKVYRADDKRTGKVVAVKLLNLQEDDEMFEKEITMMEKIQSECIVQYYGHWVNGHQMGIVMEYCGGGPVNELMRVEGRCVQLPEEIIKVICRHVLNGLSWLHSNRKIHRDIKGCNILLTEDGHAKLADFGIAARISTIAGQQQTVIGTPFWMAPEVIGSENEEAGYDFKADIWSLGITALEMAETRPPYADKHYIKAMHLIHQNDPPKLKQPRKWSGPFQDFLEKCLTKDPSQRASAAELLEHPFITSAIEMALTDFIRKEWHNIVARRNTEVDAGDYDYVDGPDDGRRMSRETSKDSVANGGIEEGDGTSVFHPVEDDGTAVFHGDGDGTAVFHGGGGDGTAVFHGDGDGTAVFHGDGGDESGTVIMNNTDVGTAIFADNRRGSQQSEDQESLDSEDMDPLGMDSSARRMTEDIAANLACLDESFESGTVVFPTNNPKKEDKHDSKVSDKRRESKGKEGKSGRKSESGRRSSRRITSTPRTSDIGCKGDDDQDQRSDTASVETANADNSGSDLESHPPLVPSEEKTEEKERRKNVRSRKSSNKARGSDAADYDETKSKGRRKVKRKSIVPNPMDELQDLEAWSVEELEAEVSKLGEQREAELRKLNQRFETKREQLEQAIAIRRLDDGAGK